jgi:hypothetical protein
MTRAQLEHIVRAAGAIADVREILVLGSQSVLGTWPHPPPPMDVSREADVFPLRAPEKADLISGAIGEVSQFDATFGYYAHGLPPSACPLPTGWEQRLVAFENENTRGVTALCLHPLDLAASKLVAGRPKDTAFVVAMLQHKLAAVHELEERLRLLPLVEQRSAAGRTLVVAVREANSLRNDKRSAS